MKLSKDDLVKFYELNHRLSENSPNVGIIGDRKTFRRKIKEILKVSGISNRRTNSVFVSDGGNRLTIIINDIEVTYIQIETLQDLRGRYFRKYI